MTDHLSSRDIEFNPRSHRYKIAGSKPAEYIPSVTTITGLLDKPFLVEWAAREAATEAALAVAGEEKLDEQTIAACIAVGRARHRELRNEGASVGTAVHQRAKRILVPGWTPDPEEVIDGGIEADMAMEAFDEWWSQTQAEGWKVVHCERIVVHPSGMYVGTFDALLKNEADGRHRLVDFKTSNQSPDNPLALYPEYMFQIAAYRAAIIDSPEYETLAIEDAQVVALGKQGQLGVTTIDGDQLNEYAVAFIHIAAMFPTYRAAERSIRAFNKAEKARRAELEGVV